MIFMPPVHPRGSDRAQRRLGGLSCEYFPVIGRHGFRPLQGHRSLDHRFRKGYIKAKITIKRSFPEQVLGLETGSPTHPFSTPVPQDPAKRAGYRDGR